MGHNTLLVEEPMVAPSDAVLDVEETEASLMEAMQAELSDAANESPAASSQAMKVQAILW